MIKKKVFKSLLKGVVIKIELRDTVLDSTQWDDQGSVYIYIYKDDNETWALGYSSV